MPSGALGLAIPGQGLQSLQIALPISLFDRVTKLVIQCRYQHYGGIGSIFLKDRFQLFGKPATPLLFPPSNLIQFAALPTGWPYLLIIVNGRRPKNVRGHVRTR